VPEVLGTIDGLAALSSVATALESGAISAAEQASRAFTSAAGLASSAITSAIGAAESAIAKNIPENVTIGTKFVCAGFDTATDCEQLPVSSASSLSSIWARLQLDSMAGALNSAPSLQMILAVGAACVVLSLCLGVLVILKFRWALCLALILNFASLALFVVVVVYAKVLFNVGSLLSNYAGVSVKQGDVLPYSAAAAAFCSVALLLGLLGWRWISARHKTT